MSHDRVYYLTSRIVILSTANFFFFIQIAPAAKKLWDKGPGAGGDSKGTPHLPPLQLNPEQMWRDPTWSAQGIRTAFLQLI